MSTKRTFKSFIEQVVAPTLLRDEATQQRLDSKSSATKAIGAGVFSGVMLKAAMSMEHKAKEARIFADALKAAQMDLQRLAATGKGLEEFRDETPATQADNVVKMATNPFVPPPVAKDYFIVTVESGTRYFYGPFERDYACKVLNSQKGLNWDLVGSVPADEFAYSEAALMWQNVDKCQVSK